MLALIERLGRLQVILIRVGVRHLCYDFTITAEIHGRSLANFYRQYADRHMNLKFMRCVSERERAIRQL